MRARRVTVLIVAFMLVAVIPLQASATVPPVGYTFAGKWGAAGTEAYQYQELWDVAADGAGNVWAVDYSQNRLDKYDSEGNPAGEFETNISSPRGVAVDRFGRVYVANGGGLVSMYTQAGTPDGAFTPGFTPDSVAVAPNGDVYVSEAGTRLAKLSPKGMSFLAGPVTLPGFPTAIATDPSGNLFATFDQPLNYVARLDPSTLSIVATFSSAFDRPWGLSVDPLGRLHVADTMNNRIRVFNSAWAGTDIIGSSGSGDGQFSFPYSAKVGWQRDFFVADTYNDRIQRFKQTAATIRTPIEGDSRVKTAVAISQKAYPTAGSTNNVLIATANNWPDALGGAALAGRMNAPILLTNPSSLSAEVKAEITRLGATQVVILGGTGAVSEAVKDEIDAMPGVVAPRLGGLDRFATADEIAAEAAELGWTTFSHIAFVATGWNYPDALAGAPISAANNYPLFLADKNGMRAATKSRMQTLGIKTVYILGSVNAVNANVEADLHTIPGVTKVERIQGGDRYATAYAVGQWGLANGGMNAANIGIATGENYPDALAAGPLLGKSSSVMLLARKSSVPASTTAGLTAWKDRIYETRYFGSASAVSDGVRTTVAGLLW